MKKGDILRKHGYAATDYIIISAVVLAAVIPFLFIAQEPLRSAPQANLDDAIESVMIAAQRLNRLADDSADRVAVVIPQGVEGDPDPVISESGILRLRIGGQTYVYVFKNVAGRFPINPGRQFVYLRKVRDKVHMYPAPICGDGRIEGSETCDPGDPTIGPCPNNCNQNCRCSCPSGSCTGQLEGYLCSASGECVPCERDTECNQAIGEACINGRCTTPPTPTFDCRLPGAPRCLPPNEVCNEQTGKCGPGSCPAPPPQPPPNPPTECNNDCHCTTQGERCNGQPGNPGQCVPECQIAPGCTTPPNIFCNDGPNSGTYGQCVPCQGRSDQCGLFPLEVCDLDPSSPTHLKCRSCVVGEPLDPAQCNPPPINNFECKEVSINAPKTICGNCIDNTDCADPTPICDPILRRCTSCYWGFYQCDYGSVCVDNQCVPVQSPQATQVSCEGGGAPGQPMTYCNPFSCPGGQVCMRQGGGCQCVNFAPWRYPPYRGTIPPHGRPDPGNPGPQPGPRGNPATNPGTPGSGGCRYNPFATLQSGDPTGNSLCADRNSCPLGETCVLTGPAACSCQLDGTPSYIQQLQTQYNINVDPSENVWLPYSSTPGGPSSAS